MTIHSHHPRIHDPTSNPPEGIHDATAPPPAHRHLRFPEALHSARVCHPTPSRTSTMSDNKGEESPELAAAMAKVTEAGDAVRDAKAAGAGKDEVMALVTALNEAKAVATGLGAVFEQPKKSKSKKSKKDKGETGDKKGPSAKELRKLERERKMKEAAEAKAKKEGDKKATQAAAEAETASRFGDLPLNQSQTFTGREWTRIADLGPGHVNRTVLVRARVHTTRLQGAKMAFILLRQGVHTVQALVRVSGIMVAYVDTLPKESIVDVEAKVLAAPEPVTSATKETIELHIETIFCVSKAHPELPFQLDDAARVIDGEHDDDDEIDEPAESAKAAAAEEGGGAAASAGAGDDGERVGPKVKRSTRLDHRWIDLRIPANQAIIRIVGGVAQLFREFLVARDFVEVMTPKLLGGASEGGAEVFKLSYFGEDACLAQSPQLYKQMMAVGADFGRVFEVGPVFRAENSNTHKHLTEFHGLDMEMCFNEHYHEVLNVFSDMFVFIFDNLKKRYAVEIEAVRKQFPFEDLKYSSPSLVITFDEGMQLLREAGFKPNPDKDPGAEEERALGKIVKEKYGTDFFIMDKYPAAARPFYSMPDPLNPRLSNSYDMFMRGEEILSGAQRVHDPELLAKQAAAKGVPPESIKPYIDSFRHGASPHGGGGIGLERVVMLFLGLHDVRRCTTFTRDPRRLAP